MKRERRARARVAWSAARDFAELWDEVVRDAPFDVPPGLGEKFARYGDELRRFNERINLIRVTSDREFASRHLLDALAGLPLLPDRGRVIDIGSGAGIPGLALAVARPDLAFTLVESIGKKAAFLSQARRVLAQDNVAVFAGRFEDVDLTEVSLFTARAVADPAALVRLVRARSTAPIAIWTRPGALDADAANCVTYRLPGDPSERVVIRVSTGR